jgi:hypothetical protein
MIRIHSALDAMQQELLTKSINWFFNELDLVFKQNSITDVHYWFTERTFLSLYLNAQIRNQPPSEVSTLQEYSVTEAQSGSYGRCDALLTINRSLFLLEAKCNNILRKINATHWDIEEWTTYDETIFKQLNWYMGAKELFFLDEKRYKEVFLQTIVFEVINNPQDQHFQSTESMDISGKMLNNRGWYYGCHYPSAIHNETGQNIGIEIYGSIVNRKKIDQLPIVTNSQPSANT